MGVSLPSGSRTRRPARSAAPGAPLGVRRGGLSHLPGGGPAPASAHQPAWPAGLLPLGSRSISSSSSPSSISSGLACWASWASSSREASLLGKAGGRGRGPHCSARPGSPPTSPPLPPAELARSQLGSTAPPSPHKQDLALGPRGLVLLGLSRQLLGPLFQQLHVVHAALPGGQVGHCGGKRGGQTPWASCPQPRP